MSLLREAIQANLAVERAAAMARRAVAAEIEAAAAASVDAVAAAAEGAVAETEARAAADAELAGRRGADLQLWYGMHLAAAVAAAKTTSKPKTKVAVRNTHDLL